MYTEELFGVEYLYDQAGLQLISSEDNLDREIYEGFEDVEDELTTGSIPILEEDSEYLSVYPPEESEEEEEEETAEEDEALDAAGMRWIPLPSP